MWTHPVIFISMSDIKFRPRFKFRTPMHPDEIRDRLRGHVRDANPAGYRLTGNLPHMVLQHAPDQQQLWTPQMDIDLEMEQVPGKETFTLVRCMIGPAPTVWMGFMGAYILLAVLSLFAVTMGISQRMLGEAPWALHATWILIVLGVGIWLLAQAGKRWSREQMLALKRFVDGAMGCDCLSLASEE